MSNNNENFQKQIESSINEFGFCCGLFAYMRKNGNKEFNIDNLESYVQNKLDDEPMNSIFSDINKKVVIQEGISSFEIIGAISRNLYSPVPKARLKFTIEQANKLILNIPKQYDEHIKKIALEFSTYQQEKNSETKNKQYIYKNV